MTDSMKRIQLLHGTKTANDAFVGRIGEVTVNTTDYSLRVHDGETAGGHAVGVTASALLDLIYPVGSIYLSVANVSPAEFVGGTWESISSGRVLMGASTAHPAGETGGAETHTLTTDEMPSHTHSQLSMDSQGSHSHDRGDMNIWGYTRWDCWHGSVYGAFSNGDSGVHKKGTGTDSASPDAGANFNANQSWDGSTNSAGGHSHTVTLNNTGSGNAHSIMQPYLSVYMWKRTA